MAAVNSAHCSIIYNRKIHGVIGALWHPGNLESLDEILTLQDVGYPS